MTERLTITQHVTFRPCCREDLPALEWFGRFARYRQHFAAQFERQLRGENAIVVAEANGFPIGRLSVDLAKRRYRIAEIGAGKDNPGGRRLYERLGYRVVGENFEEWDVTAPDGSVIHESSDEWILQRVLDLASP